MNRGIVVPTYYIHFEYIDKLLESYDYFVDINNNVKVFFIVSDEKEANELKGRIKKYLDKYNNIYIYNFEKILKKYNINITSNKILEEVGRYTYQTIKKLYALHYLQLDQALVIDSESIFCNYFNLDDIFNKYFKKPYIFYSVMPDTEIYRNFLDYKTSVNCSNLLNVDFSNKWFLEGFHWFYEKNIINDLFNYFNGKLFEKIYLQCKNKDFIESAIFECILYYTYIYNYNYKYKYNFINSKDELMKCMKKKSIEEIKEKMKKANLDFLPFSIHSIEFAKYKDIIAYKNFYKKNRVEIARLGCGANLFKPLAFCEICKQLDLKIIVASDKCYENLFWLKHKTFESIINNKFILKIKSNFSLKL